MPTMQESQLNHLRRLPTFHAKSCFLVNAHIARDFSHAGKLLRAMQSRRRATAVPQVDDAAAYSQLERRGLA